MEWLTLALSITGTLTGALALGWQVRTWRRGSHRVVVDARPGMMLHDVYANETWGPFVRITASNRGSSPVNVTGWGIRFADGSGAMQVEAETFLPDVRLPHRLEVGTSVEFYMREETLRRVAEGKSIGGARAAVSLATGQTILSRRGSVDETPERVTKD